MFTDPAWILIWLLSFSPILVLTILLIFFNLSVSFSCFFGLILGIFLSFFIFDFPLSGLVYGHGRAFILAFYVLYIIWASLFLYYVSRETGSMDVIGSAIGDIFSDRLFRLLVIGWIFSSFLQGIAGFGVPIAMTAPLLLGMGFRPLLAVLAPSIGHSWSVNFGNMATSFEALSAITGFSGYFFVYETGLLLGLGCFLCGLSVYILGRYLDDGAGSVRGLGYILFCIFILSFVMGGVQYLASVLGFWTVGGFSAGLAGLGVSFFLFGGQGIKRKARISHPSFLWSLSAYMIFIVMVLFLKWLPFSVEWRFIFPDGVAGRTLSLWTHPGTQLFLTGLICFFLYYFRGFYGGIVPGGRSSILGVFHHITGLTLNSCVSVSFATLWVVCMAVVMSESGMTLFFAQGLESIGISFWPLLSPFVGGVGTFLTGSTTNSNIIFGVFQSHMGQSSGLGVGLILAAQASGASLGSMFAPTKLLLGCALAGLMGREGEVLRYALFFGFCILFVIGLTVLGAAYI